MTSLFAQFSSHDKSWAEIRTYQWGGRKIHSYIGSVPSRYSSEGLSGVLLGHYTRQTNNATNLKRISIT